MSLFQECQVPFFFTWQNSFILSHFLLPKTSLRFCAVDRQYTRLMDTSHLPFPPDTPPLPSPLSLPCETDPVRLFNGWRARTVLMSPAFSLTRLAQNDCFHVANPTPTEWSFLSHSVSGTADCFLAFASSAQEYPTIHCHFS